MTDTIFRAIAEKRTLKFYYDSGKGRSLREVEPHALGYDSNDDLTLSAWQLSGGSGTGFRDFHVSNLSALSITDRNFSGPRPGYNRQDKTLKRIVCRL